MTALSIERNTIRMDSSGQVIPDLISLPIAANVVAYQGGIACLNAAGYGVNSSSALAVRCIGRWSVDVNSTGMAAGALNVNVDQGVFNYFSGTSTDLISQANVGSLCYLIDDQTVGLTNGSGTRSVAGVIFQVDANGSVWVQMGLVLSQITPVQLGTVTLVAGTKTINTGITLTANSVVTLTRRTQGGTVSSTILYEELGASRVVGPAGTASMVIQASVQAGTVAATDTSTLEFTIQG